MALANFGSEKDVVCSECEASGEHAKISKGTKTRYADIVFRLINGNESITVTTDILSKDGRLEGRYIADMKEGMSSTDRAGILLPMTSAILSATFHEQKVKTITIQN